MPRPQSATQPNSSIPEAAADLSNTLGNTLQHVTDALKQGETVAHPIRAESKAIHQKARTARIDYMAKSQQATLDSKTAVHAAAAELGSTLAAALQFVADSTTAKTA